MEEAPAERGVSSERTCQVSKEDARQSSVNRDKEELDESQVASFLFLDMSQVHFETRLKFCNHIAKSSSSARCQQSVQLRTGL